MKSPKKVLCIIGVLFVLVCAGKVLQGMCAKDGCTNPRWRSSRYCTEHDVFYEGTMTYERNHYGYSSGTSSYTNKNSYNSTGSSSKNNTSTTSSSKKPSTNKKEMPDCDDYDSYDDFMDDWDGNMPDGSDAEDYWEDWN